MRVLVTGASGSGTSTLGRALSTKWNVPFFEVDDYFWLPSEPPYQKQRDPGARVALLLADLDRASRSVTSGSVIDWGAALEDSFSLVVFLTLPPELRLARLRERETARFGSPNPEFVDWAAQYDEGELAINSRRGDEQWLAARSCPVLRLDGDLPVSDRVARVVAWTASQ